MANNVKKNKNYSFYYGVNYAKYPIKSQIEKTLHLPIAKYIITQNILQTMDVCIFYNLLYNAFKNQN